jgi:DNA-binding NarL/FixJ family response regulator
VDKQPIRLGTVAARQGVPVTLILIDDHAILRDGLRSLLHAQGDCEVIAEASGVAEGIALTRQLEPDVAVIDISFPVGDGLEAIGRLRGERDVKVIVLTAYDTQEHVRAAMNAGAHAFVAKDTAFEVLLHAVRSAMSLDPGFARFPLGAPSRGSAARQHTASMLKLTLREREILIAVAQGLTSKQIATQLSRSVKTIIKHRSNMMSKLSLHDASAVTRFAIANGLVRP